MAHTKAGGSTKLGRDSRSKRLGVKISDGQKVNLGGVIIRQRGTKYLPGNNTARGSDDTIYAKVAGIVKFLSVKKIRFDRSLRWAKKIVVIKKAA